MSELEIKQTHSECSIRRSHSLTRQSSAGRQMLGIFSVLVLCVVIPLWLHAETGGSLNGRSPWWAVVTIVLSGIAYSLVIASGKRQLFAMVLWLFTYVFMGLAPYVQYRLDELPSTTPGVDQSMFPVASAVVFTSSLAALAGMYLASTRPVKDGIRKVYVDRRKANILTVFSFLLFAYYSYAVGFNSFLLSRLEFSIVRQQTWPNPAMMSFLTGGLNMTLLVGFIAQMILRQQARSHGQKAPFALPLMNALILIYAVNPISSARYVVGTVILAMLAALGAYSTVARFRMVAASAMAGLLILFPLGDLFRYSRDATLEFEGPIRALTSADFDAFAQLTTTLQYVQDHGSTLGGQLLGVLLFWVPRSLWPEKPVDTGVKLAEYLGYNFTNLSSPIWAELFIDFGWIGTILGMGILGYWFRIWDTRTNIYLHTSRIPPVAACVVAFYLLIVLRGSLLNAASYLLVIFLASWFVSSTKRKTVSR